MRKQQTPITIVQLLEALAALASEHLTHDIRHDDFGGLVLSGTPGEILDRLIEKMFTGPDGIRRTLARGAKPEPKEEKPKEKKTKPKEKQLDPREVLLAAVAEHGMICAKDYKYLFDGERDPGEKVRKILKALVEEGLLERRGQKSGTFYIDPKPKH